jgi:VanZ family protein
VKPEDGYFMLHNLNNRTHPRSIVWYLLPLLLWILIIILLSLQPYSQQSVQPWLKSHFTPQQLADRLPDVTIHYLGSEVAAKKRPYTFVEFFVRKGAHLFVYSVLAVLSYLFVTPFLRRSVWKMMVALFAVLLVGGLDEWNQSFTTARTGAVQDIGIDLLGAGMVLLLVILIERRRK